MPGMKALTLTLSILTVAVLCPFPQGKGNSPSYRRAKPRILITADPELDDSNSLIRFLLYSTDVRIEGLIYASSQFHCCRSSKNVFI